MRARSARTGACVALTLLACDTAPRVVVTRDEAVVLDLRAHVARDEDARRRGLRGRALADDQGLFFVFPGTSEVCLVNDGVTFDVDALFVLDGRVASRARLVVDDPTPRCAEASEVLETRAEVTREVAIGDAVELLGDS